MKRLLCVLLTLSMLLVGAPFATADEPPYTAALREAAAYLTQTVEAPTVGSVGGEWAILGLARGGCEVPDGYFETYYANVLAYVSENCTEDGKLSGTRSTDNSRLILALTAIGKDPTDVGGYDLLQPLAELSFVQKQGVNGSIYALLALNSNRYAIPNVSGDVTRTTREALVQAVLDNELETGGWTYFGTEIDPDLTGVAVQALSPYDAENEQVHAAIERALTALSAVQNPDGSFSSWGEANCESCAQVLCMLTSLGMDPEQDARFVKNGNTVVDALLRFAAVSGGFVHTTEDAANLYSTEQALYSLAAYKRLTAEQTSLYDMTDVYAPTAQKGDLDADGTVTVADALRLYKAAGGYVVLTAQELEAADVDGDRTVDMRDAFAVYLFVAGKLSTL